MLVITYLFHSTVEENLPITFVSIFRHLYPKLGEVKWPFGYFQTSVQKVNEVRMLAERGKIIQTLTVKYFNALYLTL